MKENGHDLKKVEISFKKKSIYELYYTKSIIISHFNDKY